VTPRRSRLISLLSRAVARPYRDEVVADLIEEERTARTCGQSKIRARVGLYVQLLGSAIDSHRGKVERDTSASGVLTGIGGDVRMAWRLHRSRPAFTLAALLMLALASGANTTLFTVAHAALWRPLPFAEPARLVFLWDVTNAGVRQPFPPARGLDFRQSQSLSGLALLSHRSYVVTGVGPAEEWRGASVSGNFFDILGVSAAAGRPFHAAESDRDVVVLSHRLWRSRFGADPAVIGRSILMNGRPRVVLGVMGEDFYWPAITAEPGPIDAPVCWLMADATDVPDVATRSDADRRLDRNTSYLRAVARLAPGADLETARAEVASIAGRLAKEHPQTDANRTATLVVAAEQMFGSLELPMALLVGFTLLVALVAAANVANLLLVRLSGRSRELTVRFALGATRSRVVRQLAVEGLLFAVAGAVLGVVMARLSFATIVSVAPNTIGRLDSLALDARPLALSLVLTLVTGALLAIVPAFSLARRRQLTAGPRGDVTTSRLAVRQVLVVAEVALALVLVIGAALFGESLLRLRRVEVGFDPSRLLTFEISRGTAAGPGNMSAHFNELLRRIRAVPGVTAAAGAATLPIGGDDFGTRLSVEGQPPPTPGAEPRIGYQLVTPGWFETLGLRLRGRDFNADDTGERGQVVIVNETFARSAWPGADALGRRVRKGRNPANPWLTVIGVTSDVRHSGPGKPARPEIYEPYSQTSLSFMAVAVRTAADPKAVVAAVRRAVAEVDPAQPLARVATMDEHLANTYGDLRFLSTLTLAFGGLALLLAALGVYGVVGTATAQRMREFGVRTALGATPRGLARLVFTGGLRTVFVGLLTGVVLALALGGTIASLLFETTPADPAVFATAAVVLLTAAGVALWVPARRAARADPVVVLRSE
jgi:putative ABC transport system permease protein